MNKFTLSIILSNDLTKVLMCKHQKFHKLNFIGGKIDKDETILSASYRELYEETGIATYDVALTVFRHQIVEIFDAVKRPDALYPDYDMYVSIGVLNKEDIKLKEEKNPLIWVDLNDTNTLLNANGDGECYVYLKQGIEILKDCGYKFPHPTLNEE